MYEIQDILFLVKNFQSPQNLDILKFISFSTTNTRSGTKIKLRQKLTRTSTTRHSYFNQVVNLWNSLPTIDIYLPLNSVKQNCMIYFGTISSQHLILTTLVPIITTVHAHSVSFGTSLHAPAIHDIVVYPVLNPVLFVIYLFTVASLFPFVYLCKKKLSDTQHAL